jgi:hypothetical protein
MADSEQLASWRRDLQQVHDSLMKGEREQFEAWFDETALIDADMTEENEEFRQSVADIKKDKQRYRQLMKQLPNVAEFSAEEVEKKSGKAFQLLDIAAEVMSLEIYLPRKVEKLAFMLKNRVQ